MSDIKEKILSYKKELSIEALAGFRRQFLHDKKFTIISNNCWAGWVYRHYGLAYQSPTVGLYMFAREYIEFCKHIDDYLGAQLAFIAPEESKYYAILKERKQEHVPIGLLADQVEIVFRHYHDQKEAYEKWNRRTERVRKDHMVYKFSEMDLCEPKYIEAFDQLPYEKKVCFTANPYPQMKSCIRVSKVVVSGRVSDDTSFYADYIDLTKFLNTGALQKKSAAQE